MGSNTKIKSFKMETLVNLIKNCQWSKIYKEYQPVEIARKLSFKEGISLAYKILFNDEGNDDLRDYAVNLIKEIKQIYPKEWDLDWRNDVFLGDACYLTMRYDERYKAYKNAFNKVHPLPSALLVAMAGCYLSPSPPITMQEAEELTQKALEKEKTVEAVTLIRGICKTKGDMIQFSYWDKILQELENQGSYIKDKWPNFLKTIQ